MQSLEDLKEHVDHLTNEVAQVKKMVLEMELKDRAKVEEAWKDLMLASEEISKRWRGQSAVEEIRQQREKIW
jgi:hypothetical protein